MSIDEAPAKRVYRSTLREQQAEATKRKILEAATEVFVEQGYGATSVGDIAARAGVARPTVFGSFETKANLLKVVVDVAMAGDMESKSVAEHDFFKAVEAATTPVEMLEAYAGVCTAINGRVAQVYEVARRAADDSAEVAALWDDLTGQRFKAARSQAKRLAHLDGLDEDLIKIAADVLWILNDPARYADLVLRRSWSPERYYAWLSMEFKRQLLDGPTLRMLLSLST
ncbi:TetR/AcrR family transcriptional regulator [Kineococcus sp. SYSU DK006]|uniref:TetR/AcrR family transcriptional regulator n=1 Tax=Kineococcus sp. SYSU DK006 TaxID=3383127 RepID=UPI003D7E1A4B